MQSLEVNIKRGFKLGIFIWMVIKSALKIQNRSYESPIEIGSIFINRMLFNLSFKFNLKTFER